MDFKDALHELSRAMESGDDGRIDRLKADAKTGIMAARAGIEKSIEQNREMLALMSEVIPESITRRKWFGYGREEPVPVELSDDIPSLRPISVLQRQALSARNYLDVGRFEQSDKLMEEITSAMGLPEDYESEEFLRHATTVDPVYNRKVRFVETEVRDSWFGTKGSGRLDARLVEANRAEYVPFDIYARENLDLYGGLPDTVRDVCAEKLNYAFMGDFENKAPDGHELFDPARYVRQGMVFEKWASLYTPELSQAARAQLTGLMDGVGEQKDWLDYASAHNVPLLTDENEFRAIVARNDRIDRGLEVPEWVKEREERDPDFDF